MPAPKVPPPSQRGRLSHEEAVRVLHHQARQGRVLGIAGTVLVPVALGVPVAVFGPGGGRGWPATLLILTAYVVVLGGLLWLIKGRSGLKTMNAALKTDTLTQAQLTKFFPPDVVVVSLSEMEQLTWRVTRRNDRPLKAGTPLWVTEPASVGERPSLIAERDGEVVILWPNTTARRA